MNATQLRASLYIAGLCGIYLAAAMFLPAAIDLYYGNRDWQLFAACGFMVGSFSLACTLATRGSTPVVSKRLAFFIVNVLWALFSLVGALPLYLSPLGLTFSQSLFESISAITTTGSTVIAGLDNAAPGILFWRSLLHWMGGIGIVALGLFVLPFLRVGGMSFFKLESSDTGDKPFAKLATFTRAFLAVYVGLTLACTIAYDMTGMGHFDALNHAMATVATGGFSTHDASFGYFQSLPLMWVGTVFMTVCSLPFSIMILFAVRRRTDTLFDPQVGFFLGYLCVFSGLLGVYHYVHNDVTLPVALTHSFFNIASILSTTGFASEDYTLWGPFAVALALFATFLGGCSGSTAGGIKAYRVLIIMSVINTGLKKLLYPNAIYPVRYGRKSVDPDIVKGIFLFVSLYMAIWVAGSLILTLLGYDLLTAISASITCLSNVGPGIGHVIGPAGNFSTISDPALNVLSVLMLLGRLEVLTVLVLFLPIFWKN